MHVFNKSNINSHYLNPVFNPAEVKQICQNINNIIKKENLHFDFIVCRGVSGLSIAAAYSVLYGIPYCIIRKDDSSHSMFDIEGYYFPNGDALIIDDFSESGATINEIINKLEAKEINTKHIIFYYSRQTEPKSYKDKFNNPQTLESVSMFLGKDEDYYTWKKQNVFEKVMAKIGIDGNY